MRSMTQIKGTFPFSQLQGTLNLSLMFRNDGTDEKSRLQKRVAELESVIREVSVYRYPSGRVNLPLLT